MNDFYKGLQILDINNDVFEKGTIDAYQSLLLDLLANHYTNYNNIYLETDNNDYINNINFSSETYKVKEFANRAAINFKYDDISEAIDYKEQLRYKYSSLRKIAPDIKTKYYMFGYTIRKHE